MRTQSSVFVALLFTFLPLTHALAQSDQEPPTAVIVSEHFTGGTGHPWQPVSGTWSGVVYGYEDPQNYHEVIISAVGRLRARTVMNGVAVDDQPDFGGTACTRDTWCELEVRRKNGVTTVKVNGQPFFQPFSQSGGGKVGLVSHAAVGRFDKVFVGVPFGDQPFLETFDGAPSVTFTPQSGQWSVANGSYRNSAIQHTSVTLAPINTGINAGSGETFEYTFRARMLDPYANSGNAVGIVFNYAGSRYSEVVFSATGVARLNLVENGVIVRTLATANYGGTRNVAFEVELQNEPHVTSVLVNGKVLFDRIGDANPLQYPDGDVGLITHWAPGRFDNVQFDHGTFIACALTFADPVPPFWIVSGAWNTNGGTLNSTAVGPNDVVTPGCLGYIRGDQRGTNEIYSARLLNEFGASGNRVGLIYNYQSTSGSIDPAEYFEVVFSPTGIMQVNKLFQGVRYPVRTRTHNIPRNTWFDVQVIRTGIFTSVKLNGTTVLANEPQGELRGGSVGVITHWTKGRFDNVRLRPHVLRPPSQL